MCLEVGCGVVKEDVEGEGCFVRAKAVEGAWVVCVTFTYNVCEFFHASSKTSPQVLIARFCKYPPFYVARVRITLCFCISGRVG